MVGEQYSSEELALRLVLAGASLACPNQDGYTPLDANIAYGRSDSEGEAVQHLLHIRTRMLQNIIHTPVWLQVTPIIIRNSCLSRFEADLQDHATNNCQMCRTGFGRLRTRKHHCRMCGRVICKQCSEFKRPISKLNCEEAVRVCNLCNAVLDSESQTVN